MRTRGGGGGECMTECMTETTNEQDTRGGQQYHHILQRAPVTTRRRRLQTWSVWRNAVVQPALLSGLSVITVEKYKQVNSLLGCQLMDWERVNAESRESRWWFTDSTRTDRAEVAHWRQLSWHLPKRRQTGTLGLKCDWGFVARKRNPYSSPRREWSRCVTLLQKKWMPCKFTECMFLNNRCGKICFVNYVDVLEIM